MKNTVLCVVKKIYSSIIKLIFNYQIIGRYTIGGSKK